MSEQVEPCLACGEKLKECGWGKDDKADVWACDNVSCFMFTNPIYDIKEYNQHCERNRLGKQAPTLLRQRDEFVKALGQIRNMTKCDYLTDEHEQCVAYEKILIEISKIVDNTIGESKPECKEPT